MVDVFTDIAFSGNPAGVVFLDRAVDERWMAMVSRELGCPNTAFYSRDDDSDRLRWFTSGGVEVRICGHGTIAAAHQLRHTGRRRTDSIVFATASGPLAVRMRDERYELTLPIDPPTFATIDDLDAALGVTTVWSGRNSNDIVAVVADEPTVANLRPDLSRLAALGGRGVIVTAEGIDTDYVLRFFGPAVGVAEDNVTGTAHCALAPLWQERLGRRSFRTMQLSPRPGTVAVELSDSTVSIAGRAVTTLSGHMIGPPPPTTTPPPTP